MTGLNWKVLSYVMMSGDLETQLGCIVQDSSVTWLAVGAGCWTENQLGL